MLFKSPSSITQGDLEAVIVANVRESRTLDFKEEYGRVDAGVRRLNDEQKREFLADITAFANTLGGDLVIGVREEGGEAVDLAGLALADPDAELLKLEGIIRDGVEPRIPGVSMAMIALRENRYAIVIRVPRSWIGPHRVIANSKFWARNSAGKYPMDVTELRQAFTYADGLIDKIRNFRTSRLETIAADEGLVPLQDGAKLVLHVIPLSAVTETVQLDFKPNDAGIAPIGTHGGWNPRYALEGLGTYSGPEHGTEGSRAYSLLFRSGVVEAVCCVGHSPDQKQYGVVGSEIEDALVYEVPGYLSRLQKEQVEGPFYLFMSLLGVKDHGLWQQATMQRRIPLKTVRKDTILYPEIVLPLAAMSPQDVKPLCDMLYNTFGFARSSSFHQNGEYARRD